MPENTGLGEIRQRVHTHSWAFEFLRQRALVALANIALLDTAGRSDHAGVWVDAVHADLARDQHLKLESEIASTVGRQAARRA